MFSCVFICDWQIRATAEPQTDNQAPCIEASNHSNGTIATSRKSVLAAIAVFSWWQPNSYQLPGIVLPALANTSPCIRASKNHRKQCMNLKNQHASVTEHGKFWIVALSSWCIMLWFHRRSSIKVATCGTGICRRQEDIYGPVLRADGGTDSGTEGAHGELAWHVHFVCERAKR